MSTDPVNRGMPVRSPDYREGFSAAMRAMKLIYEGDVQVLNESIAQVEVLLKRPAMFGLNDKQIAALRNLVCHAEPQETEQESRDSDEAVMGNHNLAPSIAASKERAQPHSAHAQALDRISVLMDIPENMLLPQERDELGLLAALVNDYEQLAFPIYAIHQPPVEPTDERKLGWKVCFPYESIGNMTPALFKDGGYYYLQGYNLHDGDSVLKQKYSIAFDALCEINLGIVNPDIVAREALQRCIDVPDATLL